MAATTSAAAAQKQVAAMGRSYGARAVGGGRGCAGYLPVINQALKYTSTRACPKWA